MDPIEIEAPDGTIVEFPAGTDTATIERAMQEQFSDAAPQGYEVRNTWQGVSEAQRNILSTTPTNPEAPEGSGDNPYILGEGTTDEIRAQLDAQGATYIDQEGRWHNAPHDKLGLYMGMAQPFRNLQEWTAGGAERVFGEGGREAVESAGAAIGIPQDEFVNDLLRSASEAGYRPGRLGQFAGSVAGTLPVFGLTRNPALAGGLESALTSNADNARDLAVDAGLGALGGRAVDALGRGLGVVINPRLNPEARALMDEGVQLTPGQLAGGAAQRMEDASTTVPIYGDMVNAAQRRGEQSLNDVAINRVLGEIGETLPGGHRTTHEAVRHMQDRLSSAYDDLIPQLQVQLDRQFGQEFNSLFQNTSGQPWTQQFNDLVQRDVASRFARNGRITGESFKEMEGILGQEVRDFMNSSSPHDRRYAAAVRELQSELRDLLARSNPAHAERLQGINRAYAMSTIVEDAARRAPEGSRGRFTATGLGQAVEAADRSVRRRATARGEALFQDLSERAAQFQRRTVNDSGTGLRAAINVGTGAALYGGAAAFNINPLALAALGTGMLPYTRVGQRVFTGAMLNRPGWAEGARRVTDEIASRSSPATAAAIQVNRNESRENTRDYRRMADEAASVNPLLEGLY